MNSDMSLKNLPTELLKINRRQSFLHGAALAYLCLSSSAQSQTSRQKYASKLLILGDSLSAEYGLKRGTGWVSLLAQRMSQTHPQFQVINASISGDTTASGRSRLPTLLHQHQPSHLIIELGGNDALRGLPLKQTQANLSDMIQTAKKQACQVLLVGMQVPPNYGAQYTQQFESMFKHVAQSQKITLAPFLLKGIADIPDASQFFQADRIHPNELAQPKMLENVWTIARTWLE